MPQYYPAGGGTPTQHAESDTVYRGTSLASSYPYFVSVASGGIITSASIITTKRCLIVVVATAYGRAGVSPYLQVAIYRGGVDKTTERNETTIDANGYRLSMAYAIETLDAGTYQYDAVQVGGATAQVTGCGIKIVAVGA